MSYIVVYIRPRRTRFHLLDFRYKTDFHLCLNHTRTRNRANKTNVDKMFHHLIYFNSYHWSIMYVLDLYHRVEWTHGALVSVSPQASVVSKIFKLTDENNGNWPSDDAICPCSLC